MTQAVKLNIPLAPTPFFKGEEFETFCLKGLKGNDNIFLTEDPELIERGLAELEKHGFTNDVSRTFQWLLLTPEELDLSTESYNEKIFSNNYPTIYLISQLIRILRIKASTGPGLDYQSIFRDKQTMFKILAETVDETNILSTNSQSYVIEILRNWERV